VSGVLTVALTVESGVRLSLRERAQPSPQLSRLCAGQ